MSVRILVAGPRRRDDYLQSYLSALRSVGAEPVREWPSPAALADKEQLRRFLAGFNGLVLPGGADVEPWRYGEESRPELKSTDAELDEGELVLARVALDLDFPTLAICRGIQILGVAVGCSLYQDLPSQKPGEIEHQVRTTPTTLAHDVSLDPGSKLHELTRSTRFLVNSRHHQAVRESSAGRVGSLTVTARAKDGVVEGVESRDHRFFVGVQWHPENLVENRSESRGLFLGFVKACEA